MREEVNDRAWHGLPFRLICGGGSRRAASTCALRALTTQLERVNLDAAASLREGLEDTLTVPRRGSPGCRPSRPHRHPCRGPQRRPRRDTRVLDRGR